MKILACILCGLAGCSKTQQYVDVAHEQRAAWKELADILENVVDEKSLKQAKTAFDERIEKFEHIAEKARSLPKPPPAEALQRLEEERYIMERTIQRAQLELKRVRDLKLPGGPEFFKNFDSKYQPLMQAVKP